MHRCRDPKAIGFSADQQTGRGLADTCRILQHGPEYGLQLTGRPADDLENFGGRGEPLQRLVTLAGASRELRFLGGSGGTAATQLWRSAALWHFRLTAARFGLFAASSGAPCHGPPQGSELIARLLAVARLEQGFATGEMGLGIKLHGSNPEPLMSALGQRQTSEHDWIMSALPPKADIADCYRHVRFVPKAD